MSIFSKLFGKKSTTPKDQRAPEAGTLSSSDLANDPNLIRVFDKYGQELFITKDEWRTNVLPGAIQSRWNQPDELYGVIVNALNDDLHSDVLKAAAQLYAIDPLPVRGACLYAIALMKNGRLDDAEQVLKAYLEKHGENGVVLTNLAKIYAERKQMEAAEQTLWHALEVDPNQDNGLHWYLTLQYERGGQEQRLGALQKIAALPGSWRAQIWLARAALDSGDLKQALSFYQASLNGVGKPIPADMLMQVSGDLGNHGHLSELIELTEPNFVIDHHALEVGNNLIKAHLQLGHPERAQAIVDQLYSLKRPDWRETLSFWDTEIAKARIADSQPTQDQPLGIELLSIDGPVWMNPASPARKLFKLAEGGPVIAFLGGSAEVSHTTDRAELQLADAPGRMTRALPLFVAEQVGFFCQASVRTWLPWIPNGGFVLSGAEWTQERLVEFSKLASDKSDYLVVIHLKTKSEPWQAEVRLLRVADGHSLTMLDASFFSANPAAGITDLARRLALVLEENAGLKRQIPSPLYQLPDPSQLANFLLREEQLLAVRCARMNTAPAKFLHGKREILEGNLQLCLACPNNVATRVLLAETLTSMNKVSADVVKEFIEKVKLLQTEHPLSEPAHSVVEEILSGI